MKQTEGGVTAMITFHRFSSLKCKNTVKQDSFHNQRHYVGDYGCLYHIQMHHTSVEYYLYRFTVKGVSKKGML